MKKVLKFLGLILLLGIAAIGGYFFLDGGAEQRSPFDFVPDDFVFAIESDKPIRDWQGLSNTEVWQYLKGTAYFADVSESADYLDELLKENKTVANLIKLGDLLMTGHMISSQDYDYIYIIDLKAGKLAKFKEILNIVFKSLEYEVKIDKFFGIDIYDLYDKSDNSTISISIMDNILVASYNKDLLKKAIQQSESPNILENEEFTFVRDKSSRNELYSVYLNFKYLNRLIGAYTSETPDLLVEMDKILSYSSMDLSMGDDYASFSGYVKQIDTVPSFLSVFKDVSKGSIRAPEVLPSNTAMYTSIGFDNFQDFYARLETYYQTQNPEEFEDLNKQKERIEKFLKIDFNENFFSWMTDEVASAIIPKDSTNSSYSYFALLHFDNFNRATQEMEFLGERIKKRTPVKFKTKEYQGFEIKYLELKGFFKLFFKKLFSRIEKPHYTFIDDYVVFSNDAESLMGLIDSYLANDILKRNDEYRGFAREFSNQSNIFTYLNNDYLYGYLLSTLDAEAGNNLAENEAYLKSFPQVGFQLSPSAGMYKTLIYSEFVPQDTLLID